MHHAIRFRAAHHPAAMGFRRGQALGEEFAADLCDAGRQQPQGDLRGGAEMGCAERFSLQIDYMDSSAGFRAAGVDYIALENPRMARCHSAGGFSVDPYFVHGL